MLSDKQREAEELACTKEFACHDVRDINHDDVLAGWLAAVEAVGKLADTYKEQWSLAREEVVAADALFESINRLYENYLAVRNKTAAKGTER